EDPREVTFDDLEVGVGHFDVAERVVGRVVGPIVHWGQLGDLDLAFVGLPASGNLRLGQHFDVDRLVVLLFPRARGHGRSRSLRPLLEGRYTATSGNRQRGGRIPESAESAPVAAPEARR